MFSIPLARSWTIKIRNTLSGISTLIKPSQLLKASSSIIVTLFGILILVNFVQFWKSRWLIVFIFEGSFTVARDLHSENACALIDVTLSGITTLTKLAQPHF